MIVTVTDPGVRHEYAIHRPAAVDPPMAANGLVRLTARTSARSPTDGDAVRMVRVVMDISPGTARRLAVQLERYAEI